MFEKLLTRFRKATDKPYVMYLLGGLSFLESVIFPIPVEVFLLSLVSAHPKRWVRYATIATTTSVLGALVGYVLGAELFNVFGTRLLNMYGYHDEFVKVIEMFQNNSFLVIFTAAFTPIPYKVFTLSAGVAGVNIWSFIIASILGRGIRFFVESYIIFAFGARAAKQINKHFNTITWVCLFIAVILLTLKILNIV